MTEVCISSTCPVYVAVLFPLAHGPPHAIIPLSALCRTHCSPTRVNVNLDSFLLLGDGTCHHSGRIRPNPHTHKSFPCPGHLLDSTRKSVSTKYFAAAPGDTEFDLTKRETPLLSVPPPPSVHEDQERSIKSQRALSVFDPRKDIFVIPAHDLMLVGVIEVFPETLC